MARSWRNFFRKSKPPENTGAPGATETVEQPDIEQPEVEEEILDPMVEPDIEPDDSQSDVEELGSEEVEVSEVELESFEPDIAPDESEDTGEGAADDSGGWFGRLRTGLKRSRESMVGQLNAAVAEFKDAEDEEFWER
ncbi:MAG: hypothetical protein WA982_12750, partial [Rubrobacteraceae bacterium]